MVNMLRRFIAGWTCLYCGKVNHGTGPYCDRCKRKDDNATTTNH